MQLHGLSLGCHREHISSRPTKKPKKVTGGLMHRCEKNLPAGEVGSKPFVSSALPATIHHPRQYSNSLVQTESCLLSVMGKLLPTALG